MSHYDGRQKIRRGLEILHFSTAGHTQFYVSHVITVWCVLTLDFTSVTSAGPQKLTTCSRNEPIVRRGEMDKTDTFCGLFNDTDTNSSKKFGLIISQGKTKYMRNTRKEIKGKDISIDNMTFEYVSSFKYLESIVNETNKIQQEIQIWIAAGNRAHSANKKLLTNKLLSSRAVP